MSSRVAVDEDDAFLGDHHVYEPFRAGLPPLGPYFREFWRRREFAMEMSRTSIRTSQNDTLFGQLWNVLNPLLLGLVYYLLTYILGGGAAKPANFFPHLLGGLFAFYLVSNAMTGGASSVTSAGGLIMNTAFPRLLLPVAEVRTAVAKFWPTMIIFAGAYLLVGLKPTPVILLALPWLVLLIIFAAGLSMLMAVSQVYFRDTRSFLPYVTRIWLYTSPVLFFAEAVPAKLKPLEVINPLFSLLGGWSDILIKNHAPSLAMWLTAAAWALASLLVGVFVFILRERDFAVRL